MYKIIGTVEVENLVQIFYAEVENLVQIFYAEVENLVQVFYAEAEIIVRSEKIEISVSDSLQRGKVVNGIDKKYI